MLMHRLMHSIEIFCLKNLQNSYNFVLFIARFLINVTGSTLLLCLKYIYTYDIICDKMIINIFIFLFKMISNRIK